MRNHIKTSECLVVLLLAQSAWGQTVYPPNLGGGQDGSNNNAHVDGSPDTPKLEMRVHCTKAVSTSTEVEMTITVYQSDVNFKYSNIGPDNGSYVEYSQCKLIQASDYITSQNIIEATDVTACGGSAQLARVDGGTLDSGFATRTFKTTITFTPSSATYTCGGYKNSDSESVFAVYCQRDPGYAKAFDYVFLSHYDADTSKCLSTQLDASVKVGDPPLVSIQREYDLTMKAYTTDDITKWPDGPESASAKEIGTTSVALGTEMYLEVCLKIPQPTANYQFFNDGVGPIGVFVKDCTASNDDSVQDTVATVARTDIIQNGCSLGVDPTKLLPKDTPAFKYVKDTVDPTLDWLRSPNCFRSYPFEAISYARKIYNQPAKIIFSCKVQYCTSSGDNRCFGSKTATDLSGYPACSRRKREISNLTTTGYPETVSVTIQVVPPGYMSSMNGACEETVLVIALNTVLAMVLILAVVGAGVVTINLNKLDKAVQKTSALSAKRNLYVF